jgi:hypothetical protein
MNSKEVKVAIKPFCQNGEWLYFCCDVDTYDTYGTNSPNYDDAITGVSEHADDAVIDFIAQYTLINGETISVSMNDFYRTMN